MLRFMHYSILYRFRLSISLFIFLVILYFVASTWAIQPPLSLFLGWQSETKLTVLEIVEDEYRQYVQPGDIVLAINGDPVRRGQLVFRAPIRSSYEFILQRGQEVVTQNVPVGETEFLHVWLFSISAVALAIWFIGLLIVVFTRRKQSASLYAGLGFQLIGAGIVSPGPAQLGVPGAWIVGNVLIYYFPLIVLYLGFLPRYSPLTKFARRLLWSSFFLLSILAVGATIEVIFLFPDRSLKDVINIDSASLLAFVAGVGVIAALITLSIRLFRSPQPSYERQQLSILLSFLSLALIPLFFFVILPVDLVLFVPYPVIFSLFLLVPAGYFFVLHRHGHLELDSLFSRLVTIVVLSLAIGMAYLTGLYMLETVFKLDFSGVGQGAFILVLFGVAIAGQRRLQSGIDLLVYGRNPLDDNLLQWTKTKLSSAPERTTVTAVAMLVAENVQAQQVAVVVKGVEQYRFLTGNVQPFEIADSKVYQDLLLRSSDPDRLETLPQWVELAVPIMARGEMLGIFMLSHPINGYYNARQVEMLQGIAETLAFGLLVIELVETMNQMSQQALFDRELQRQQIATEIHNEPLHALTTTLMEIQMQPADVTLGKVSQTIRQATEELRRIILGLRPPVLTDSAVWIVKQLVRSFSEENPDVEAFLDIKGSENIGMVSEQTKMALYYILTEALNNIRKHSKATTVQVEFSSIADNLVLVIHDNGVGTDVGTRPLTELLRRHHWGVADMYRWASIGQGRLEINRNSPAGTRLELILPVNV